MVECVTLEVFTIRLESTMADRPVVCLEIVTEGGGVMR